MTRVETGGMEIMSAKSRDPPFPPTATERPPRKRRHSQRGNRRRLSRDGQPRGCGDTITADTTLDGDLVKASPSTRTRITQAAVRHLGQ